MLFAAPTASSARLAIVIEAMVAADGAIVDSDLYRGVVTNKAKLAHTDVEKGFIDFVRARGE